MNHVASMSFALALAALGLGACRSTAPSGEGPPLPFHVVLLPTEVHDLAQATETSTEPVYAEEGASDPPDDMRVELTTAEMSRALEQGLSRAFVRTTRLELPEDRSELERLGPLERDRYWQSRARAAGADLLMRTRLLVDPAVEGRRNDKFWLNLPLFFLGGPMCYFVGDRRYEVSARLQADVFDVSEGHDSLADYALLPLPLYAEFQGLDLRFIDRADDLGDYALSLIVPSGLLARETPEIEADVEERVPAELGRELGKRVLAARAQFERNLGPGRVPPRGRGRAARARLRRTPAPARPRAGAGLGRAAPLRAPRRRGHAGAPTVRGRPGRGRVEVHRGGAPRRAGRRRVPDGARDGRQREHAQLHARDPAAHIRRAGHARRAGLPVRSGRPLAPSEGQGPELLAAARASRRRRAPWARR